MPSTVRSDKWFFRVTVPHEFAKSLVPRLMEWMDLDTLLIATHVGDKTENPHVHAVISLKTVLQKQSFDTRIKNIFGVKGNGQYSSKPWDGQDGACSYLFHEPTAQIIGNRGYTEADLDRFSKLNQDVQQVVSINKERASNRHVDKVMDVIGNSGRKWDRREILQEFILRIKAGEMYDPGDFMLKRYIEEIMIKQTVTDRDMYDYVHDRFYSIYRT